jgi:hypothetical protein
MEVGGIDPARRRDGDKVVGEVDEDVDEVPVPDPVGVRVASALRRRVVAVPALHVVAHQDAVARRERLPCPGHGRAVEGEVEVGGGGEVGARGERGEVCDGVGDGQRRRGGVERRLPRPAVVARGGSLGLRSRGGGAHGAESAQEAAETAAGGEGHATALTDS